MTEIAISGGLGDALIGYAKLHSADCPFNIQKDDIKIVRFASIELLKEEIEKFYELQGLTVDTRYVDTITDVIHSVGTLDYKIVGDIHGCIEDDNVVNNWKINPFPPINVTQIVKKHEIVISPTAGREAKIIGVKTGGSNKRILNVKQLYDFAKKTNKKVTLIGWADELYARELSSLPVDYNLINKTSLQEAIDIVASADVNIVHDGFMSFLSGMLGKKTYVNTNNDAHRVRLYHPRWNITFYKDLGEIIE